MCHSPQTLLIPHSQGILPHRKVVAQVFAHLVQGVRTWIGACAVVMLIGCGHSALQSVRGGGSVDALVPTGRNLFLFDFAQKRYQKRVRFGADGKALCGFGDALRGQWWAPENWLALPAPAQPFQPIEALWGPNGNFYLLDGAGKRLCQYDADGQFISSLPLPKEIRDRNLERCGVFRTRDGLFSFLDYSEGLAWQFEEMKHEGGSGDWRLRNAVRLPLGLRSCLWEPYFSGPCCRMDNQGGGGICFDGYFNRVGPWKDAPETGLRETGGDRSDEYFASQGGAPGGLRILTTTKDANWKVELGSGPECRDPIRFCFTPERSELVPCDSTDSVISADSSARRMNGQAPTSGR